MDEELIAKLLPSADKVYEDVGSEAAKEVGGLLTDVVKTFRLIFAPIQYTAFLQDTLKVHLKKSLRKVSEENLIPPVRSLALPILEQLKFHEDGILADLYINLLSCTMDRERVSYAHPGFINIISQMAPDEALLLEQLSGNEGKIYIRCADQSGYHYAPLEKERQTLYANMIYDESIEARVEPHMAKPERLASPDLFLTYVEHLVALGIVQYTNEDKVYVSAGVSRLGMQIDSFVVRLSKFGILFHTACMEDPSFGSAYD
ncbi:hypothetical protein B723_19615 [Pseudomonas fluorescens NCIMB 11764]|uniref:DUF4393 domain-containing protein n=1 Tax=Pseudomonas fluorescens NCIMB 11764 TaxID=1221522 RepID=A0A0K1QRZ5_PSEFL|nr:Abi-alpha family protein [Pseudomonas fluorescens]AKV08483.1 hypothetical protein B723_19615 [Pseudomonas fluorescens NCIMB 11764]